MIIDFHTHLAWRPMYSQPFLAGLVDGHSGESSEKIPGFVDRWLNDSLGARHVREMDAAGIARSVLLMIDSGVHYGEAGFSLENAYQVHRQVLERWRDRFIVFAGVDPRRNPSALALFRRSVTEWDFFGMKLYPPMGFAPTDARLDPYLDICAERNLPVLTHTGVSLPHLNHDFAAVRHVIELARRRPELTIVMAHAGYSLEPQVREALELGNVFADFTGVQALERDQGVEVATSRLKWIFEPKWNDRIIFGSDYPLFHFLSRGISADLQRVHSVFVACGQSDTIRLENILWRNAERLLNRSAALQKKGGSGPSCVL